MDTVGLGLGLGGLVVAGRRGAWSVRVRPVSAVLRGPAAAALVVDGIGRL